MSQTQKRFPSRDQKIPLAGHEAFQLKNEETRKQYKNQYRKTAALYYEGQPPFEEIMDIISKNLERM